MNFFQAGMADICINPKDGEYLKWTVWKLTVYESRKAKFILLSFSNFRNFVVAL